MNIDGKRYYATGSRGFTGSYLVKELNARKCFSADLGEADVVYHLSHMGLADSIKNPSQSFILNVLQTTELIDWIKWYRNNPMLIFTSTGSVYGEPVYSPQDEKHPLNATTIYGVNKIRAEEFIQDFSPRYVILRLYNIVGKERGLPQLFIRQILNDETITINGDGEQKRCFTSVYDIVNALILAYEKEEATGKIFNIAGPRAISVIELLRLIERTLGKKAKITYAPKMIGDISSFIPSIEYARQVLGYEPKYTIEQTVNELCGEIK